MVFASGIAQDATVRGGEALGTVVKVLLGNVPACRTQALAFQVLALLPIQCPANVHTVRQQGTVAQVLVDAPLT